jgi:hypothetical protein
VNYSEPRIFTLLLALLCSQPFFTPMKRGGYTQPTLDSAFADEDPKFYFN